MKQLTLTKVGDWVLITGKKCKLSKPWHGPYRVTQKSDPDVTVIPVYFPESGSIQMHQCRCPSKWPTSFYWYGGNKLSRGGVPRWLEKLLSREPTESKDENESAESTKDTSSPEQDDTTAETSETLTPQEEEIKPTYDSSQELLASGNDQATSTFDQGLLPNGRYSLRRAVKLPESLVQQVLVRDEHTS